MILLLATSITVVLIVLAGWRYRDHAADRDEMNRILTLQPQTAKRFQRAMIDDLPEPAQRYFLFAIEQGTPLLPVVDLLMTGKFSLGSKDRPDYMQIEAHEVLKAPHGFVWKMHAKTRHLRLSGSDSLNWLRYWIGGLIPVARVSGNNDLVRAAFGRMVAEAVFWTPAALLPHPNITWQALGADAAKVTILHAGMVQSVEITLAPDGQPLSVRFDRWSDANPEKKYQLQPFGGYLSEFRRIQGYQVPTHVEAGNYFGTDDYFPFFVVDVTKICFPNLPH